MPTTEELYAAFRADRKLEEEKPFNTQERYDAFLAAKEPPPAPAVEQPDRTIVEAVNDAGLALGQGVNSVAETFVGVGDMFTGGEVGKDLKRTGIYDPQAVNETIQSWKSPAQQWADKQVADAKGVGGTLVAAGKNPSVVVGTILQSLPAMFTGAKVAKVALGTYTSLSPAVIASIGEGFMMMGSSAEQMRQQTPDGKLTGNQSLMAATVGVAGSFFGRIGSKVAAKYGITDIDVAAVGGDIVEAAVKNGFNRTAVRRFMAGAFAEGWLEELPQSVSETIIQNIGLDKDIWEGVDKAAVMGTLAGMGMGGPMNLRSPNFKDDATDPAPEEETDLLGGEPEEQTTPLGEQIAASDQTKSDIVDLLNPAVAAQTRLESEEGGTADDIAEINEFKDGVFGADSSATREDIVTPTEQPVSALAGQGQPAGQQALPAPDPRLALPETPSLGSMAMGDPEAAFNDKGRAPGELGFDNGDETQVGQEPGANPEVPQDSLEQLNRNTQVAEVAAAKEAIGGLVKMVQDAVREGLTFNKLKDLVNKSPLAHGFLTPKGKTNVPALLQALNKAGINGLNALYDTIVEDQAEELEATQAQEEAQAQEQEDAPPTELSRQDVVIPEPVVTEEIAEVSDPATEVESKPKKAKKTAKKATTTAGPKRIGPKDIKPELAHRLAEKIKGRIDAGESLDEILATYTANDIVSQFARQYANDKLGDVAGGRRKKIVKPVRPVQDPEIEEELNEILVALETLGSAAKTHASGARASLNMVKMTKKQLDFHRGKLKDFQAQASPDKAAVNESGSRNIEKAMLNGMTTPDASAKKVAAMKGSPIYERTEAAYSAVLEKINSLGFKVDDINGTHSQELRNLKKILMELTGGLSYVASQDNMVRNRWKKADPANLAQRMLSQEKVISAANEAAPGKTETKAETKSKKKAVVAKAEEVSEKTPENVTIRKSKEYNEDGLYFVEVGGKTYGLFYDNNWGKNWYYASDGDSHSSGQLMAPNKAEAAQEIVDRHNKKDLPDPIFYKNGAKHGGDVQFSASAETEGTESSKPSTDRQDIDLAEKMKKQKALKAVAGNAQAVVPADPRLVNLAKVIENLFKVKVVFVSGFNGRVDGLFDAGVALNAIFVNADLKLTPFRVIGHELMHHLQAKNPAFYRQFKGVMFDYMKSIGKYTVLANSVRLNAQGAVGKELTLAEIGDEMLADFLGEQLADPAFWKKLAKFAPKKVGIINFAANQLFGILSKIKASMGRLTSEEYFKEIDDAREVLAAYLGKMIEQEGATGAAKKSDPRFAVREVGTDGIKTTGTGRIVGAPPWVKTKGDVLKLRNFINTLITEGGEHGRFWYEESGRAVKQMFNGNAAEASKFIQLLAIFSPATAVAANTTAALKAWYQYKDGKPIKAGVGSRNEKASALLYEGKEDWKGIKTSTFYTNLMAEVDSKFDPENLEQGATVDMWVARVLGYNSDSVSDAQYKFAETLILDAANKIGWEPHQVQAAIWIAVKGRHASMNKKSKAKSKKSGKDLFDTLRKQLPASGKTQTAGYNFGNAIAERTAQISWEAKPGKNSGVLPGIFNAPLSEQIAYMEKMEAVFRGENGQDILAEKLGLQADETLLGPSAWEGDIGSGAQTLAPIDISKGVIPAATVAKLNQYAAIKGYVLQQDAVVWHYPIYKGGKKNHNGVDIDFGRPLSHKEVRAIYDALIAESGREDLAPAITGTGVRVLNFTDDLTNPQFHGIVQSALESMADKLPEGVTFKSFRSEGDYISNDWSVNKNGEGYKNEEIGYQNSTGWAERSDLQGWVQNELYPKVYAVNKQASEEFGWGDPGRAKFSVRAQRSTGSDRSGDERTNGLPTRDGKVRLHHWGRVEGLSSLDPSKYGTGIAGAEARRKANDPGNWVDRTYFGVVDGVRAYVKERALGEVQYQTDLDATRLYDLVSDPDGLRAKSSDWGVFSHTLYEKNIKDAGYDGYWADNEQLGMVVASFKPVEVTPALDFGFDIDTELTAEDEAKFSLSPEERSAAYASMGMKVSSTGVITKPNGKVVGNINDLSAWQKWQAFAVSKIIDPFNGWVDGTGALQQKIEYNKLKNKVQGSIDLLERRTRKLYDTLSEANDAQKKIIFKYLTTKNASSSMLPGKFSQIVIEAKEAINQLGEGNVARGLMSQEALDEHGDGYLPRLYLAHMLGDRDGSIVSTGTKAQIDHLKQRKDINKDIREFVLGEIQDPAYLASKAITVGARTQLIFDLISDIAKNPKWVLPKVMIKYSHKTKAITRLGNIEYRKNDDGTYDLFITKNSSDTILKENLSPTRLASKIDPATAAEILANKGKPQVVKRGTGYAITPWRKLGELSWKKNKDGTYNVKTKQKRSNTTQHSSVAEANLTNFVTDSQAEGITKSFGKMDGGRNMTPLSMMAEVERLLEMTKSMTDPAAVAETTRLAEDMKKTATEIIEEIDRVHGINMLAPDTITGDYRMVPDSVQYGDMRGLVVRKEIFEDLVGSVSLAMGSKSVAEEILGQNGALQRAHGIWKWTKTAGNITGHFRNFYSNLIFVNLEGVPMVQIPILLSEIIVEMRKKAVYDKTGVGNPTEFRHWQVALENGVAKTGMSATELQRIETEFADTVKRDKGEESHMGKVARYMKAIYNVSGDVYQLNESLGKTMIVKHHMAQGMDAEDSVIRANRALFDYSQVNSSIKWLRTSIIGSPFITFAAKSLPRMAEVALTKPWRLIPYLALHTAMLQSFAFFSGADDDDVPKVKKALSEWIREKQHTYLLPFKDEAGRWQVLDLGYIFPWTAWTEAVEGVKQVAEGDLSTGALKIVAPVALGGPFLDIATAIATNTDSFSGKKIVPETAVTPAEQIQAMVQYAWAVAAPPFLTSHGPLVKSLSARDSRIDLTNDPEVTSTQAVARWFGVNMYSFRPEETRAANIRQMDSEIKRVARAESYAIADRNLTDKERTEKVEDLKAKIIYMTDKMNEYIEESDFDKSLYTERAKK